MGLPKRTLLALFAAITVAGVMAVPVIKVVVQQLGAGYADVFSPVSAAAVSHIFRIDHDGIKLDAVKIVFDKDLPAGSYVRVELRDANGNVLTAGEVHLSKTLTAGTPLTIDLTPDLDIYKMIEYSRIVVLVAGPETST